MPLPDSERYAFLSPDTEFDTGSDDRKNLSILSTGIKERRTIKEDTDESRIGTIKKMASIAYHALDSKKGEDIQVIDISEISVLADYFIIANGTSNSQVQALVDNVEEELAKGRLHPKTKRRLWSWNLGFA